jgi:hypothetical protein
MLGHIRRAVGNRSPSFTGTLTVDGANPNLPGGSTAKFQMRNVKTGTLKVDSAAVIDSLVTGDWHYDPAALDVDTEGYFVAWLKVTLPGGATQESPEQLVEFYDHSPSTNEYVSVAEVKETLGMKSGTYAEPDLQDAVQAASRTVDAYCRRFFYLTTSQTRVYTAVARDYVLIDDAVTITTVTDQAVGLVLGTNYYRAPSNADTYGEPWTALRAAAGYYFSRGVRDAIAVTGTFGWPAIPANVRMATKILAGRLLLRPRQAVFGVVGFDFDGAAIRLSTTDPDLVMLLSDFRRSALIE